MVFLPCFARTLCDSKLLAKSHLLRSEEEVALDLTLHSMSVTFPTIADPKYSHEISSYTECLILSSLDLTMKH
jgi:hypothetical protein